MAYPLQLDSFKIKDIERFFLNCKSSKLESMFRMLKYIVDEDLTLSEKVVYFKNINRYLNRECTILGVFIYIVHNEKLHIICYDDNKNQSMINSYSVSDISRIILREGKLYQDRIIELTIFLNKDEYKLNNYEDAFNEENTDILADAIIDLYRKINS